jgi:hypothetical protein
MTSRGRTGKVDVESLEKDNEKGLDSLAERVGLLKAVCCGSLTPKTSVSSPLPSYEIINLHFYVLKAL